MKRSIYSFAVVIAAAASLSAQEGVSPFTMQFGAGFTQGVGHTGRDLHTGWNLGVGVGHNFSEHVGAMLNFNSQFMGTAVTVPNNLSVAGGNLYIFSATIDPIVHLMPGKRMDAYITGGAGMFRRSFSPALTFALRSDYSVIKPGWDAGLGFAVGSPWKGKIFAEARFVHIYDNNNFFTNYVPVTFGYRW
jgi:hypothetical protein